MRNLNLIGCMVVCLSTQIQSHANPTKSVRGNVLASRSGRASFYDGNSRQNLAMRLPRGTRVRVTNPENGKSFVGTTNDSGPYVAGRIVDVSREKFRYLYGSTGRGVGPVRVEILSRPKKKKRS